MIDFYNKQYKAQGIRDADALYIWILSLLNIKENQKVLDVSCGEGILEYCAERKKISIIGLDFSSSALEIARSRITKIRLALGDGEMLPFQDETFDYVVNLGSLEHFLHPERGLTEVARVLKKDGVACFLLPNSYYVLDIMRLMLTGQGPHHYQPLERFATKLEWQNSIEEYGFKVIKTFKYNTRLPASKGDIRWYFKRPKRLIMLLTNWFIPFNLSYSFVFICQKPDALYKRAYGSS
jgi:ubiquinone/menaquinone biosynthesis C-methylase UbiE